MLEKEGVCFKNILKKNKHISANIYPIVAHESRASHDENILIRLASTGHQNVDAANLVLDLPGDLANGITVQ